MARVENLTGPMAHHAEGPVWSPTWGGLRYVDIPNGDLLTLRDDGVERLHVGRVAAFHRPRTTGGYVVALERCLAFSETPDALPVPGPDLWQDQGVRFNDGGCSPAGTLYAGTMAYDSAPRRGSLFRVTGAHGTHVETVLDDVTVSNGIGWSPDGARVYYNDTPTRYVDVFDDVDDLLTNRRHFVSIHPPGMPDGLTVDAEGGVWVAVWGAAAVHRYDPDGNLSEVVDLPASQVSACTFGGPDLDTLFITTSRENLADDVEPQAGSVFAVQPGVRGLPVLPYAG
jgi:sugar lactone lactonase YvrE